MIADPDLKRLEVLRQFKARMTRKVEGENVSPFDDRVTTSQGDVTPFDLTSIHGDIRQAVENTIADVRDGTKKSQVILIAGDAGTGKSHLLRTFQPPARAEEGGYVYVGGSNHWSIKEFEARLLDWMIEALTSPSPASDHLLLDRVRVIGFRALEQLLASPVAWQQCLARPGRGLIGWLSNALRAPSHARLKAMAEARDPGVFAHLDFAPFSAYVCDRFLVERSNITHRYALRVLLTYLFPDPADKGVGGRERVLHWFRGRADGDYFHRRLGAAEKLDRQFALFEAVKLLIHLFSPAVSKELSTSARPCLPRVFLLVFDQAEGRDELFDARADWLDFFAHLSELYNTLPNVVVLFTATIKLRNEMHGNLERQFKDRIQMGNRFHLRLPDVAQVLELYRRRVEHWLRDDPLLLADYQALGNPAAPFNSDAIEEIAGRESVRDTLQRFDAAFHSAMDQVCSHDPAFDYLFRMNELRHREAATSGYSYCADHLETVQSLLAAGGDWLVNGYQVRIEPLERYSVGDSDSESLLIKARDLTNPGIWLGAYIVLIRFQNIQAQIEAATKLLQDRHSARSRYTLWLVRANRINQWEPDYPDQTFHRVVSPEEESALRALSHVIAKRGDYEHEGNWDQARQFVLERFGRTYLADLFGDARKRLDGVIARQANAEAVRAPAEGG